ncbi:permease prefix domain 1-containing protein [Cohnella cellulosilytica]|uniref:Permease prefix domain 1-containing protein n=1 Tax=Cohnella cellulosilytica TaxID=986710 RepID=A0ABW2F4S6_9BACL
MFAGLPRNPELMRLKQELLTGMEEKYLELKREGKSENEAIGIVISEFGNIEELTAELGIDAAGAKSALHVPVPMLSEDEAYLTWLPNAAPDYGPVSALFSLLAGWRCC